MEPYNYVDEQAILDDIKNLCNDIKYHKDKLRFIRKVRFKKLVYGEYDENNRYINEHYKQTLNSSTEKLKNYYLR